MNNKWIRAAVPALLIHCSIGTVYCWSTFKEAIAEHIGMSVFSVGWAFSLAIFFLGLSAAFAGKMVEKDIKKSSLLSCIAFTAGMLGTGLCINFFSGTTALIGIYIFYGAIMGIGLGVGYITPVKTLMLWFSDNKGMATGISIMGFGLAKAIATPIMELLLTKAGISGMFYALGVLYFIMMIIGHKLIKKPDDWTEANAGNTDFLKFAANMSKNPKLVAIWLMFFINIHCGLMLISYEKQILNTSFAGSTVLAVIISVVPSITALANAGGRIGYAAISDKMKSRNTVYKIIFLSAIFISLIGFITKSITVTSGIGGILTIALLIIINAGYGGGFATLPALLSQEFGMEKVSQIHGLTLTAWAAAGLTGNNLSELILKNSGTYNTILLVTIVMYVIALIVSFVHERYEK